MSDFGAFELLLDFFFLAKIVFDFLIFVEVGLTLNITIVRVDRPYIKYWIIHFLILISQGTTGKLKESFMGKIKFGHQG